MPDRAYFEARRDELRKGIEQNTALVHALDGALQECERILRRFDEEEEAARQVKQGEAILESERGSG